MKFGHLLDLGWNYEVLWLKMVSEIQFLNNNKIQEFPSLISSNEITNEKKFLNK
jgi:hypothetical protein